MEEQKGKDLLRLKRFLQDEVDCVGIIESEQEEWLERCIKYIKEDLTPRRGWVQPEGAPNASVRNFKLFSSSVKGEEAAFTHFLENVITDYEEEVLDFTMLIEDIVGWVFKPETRKPNTLRRG